MGRSTYVVELSVDPGGERRGDLLVYANPAAVEEVIRREVARWTTEGDEADLPAPGPPQRMLLWVVSRGVVVDAIDLATLVAPRSEASGGATFDFERLRERLPPLEGKRLEPGQSIRPSTAAFLAGADARWSGSYLAELDGSLMYGCNDLEQEERYPLSRSDPYDPSNSGFQAFLLACLRRAAPEGGFEDEEYVVEVLWSAPADPNKAVKGQRAGHLLCRDLDDDTRFALFTQHGKRWVWRKGTLDEVLASLPPELAAAARTTLDEPPLEA